jgi:hypothetical protein
MRYIDADALIKKIYPMGIGDGKYTINAKAVKFAIDNTPTADVVPKSEVEELSREYESLAKTVNEGSELIRKLRSKIDDIKKDRYQLLPDGRLELLPRTDIDKIKTKLASEIFAEIERNSNYSNFEFVVLYKKCYAELKKKYAEGN